MLLGGEGGGGGVVLLGDLILEDFGRLQDLIFFENGGDGYLQ